MDDIEKSRVAYVQQLETKLQHLQAEYEKYKAAAEKWEPKVTVLSDPKTQKTTIGLQFGGKHVHATVTAQWLCEMDQTGAVTGIVDALVESLVVEQLRKVIAPEVERAQKGAKAVEGAGKW